MKIIESEKVIRIIKNKKRLEKLLNVKINNKGREVIIDGTVEDEYEATQVIDALNFGFNFSSAISIKEEGKIFEIINIKDYTGKANLERIRGRIIGKGGKTLRTLSELTKCSLELRDNKLGVIGFPEDFPIITSSIIELIQGAKHGNVYKGIEKNKPEFIDEMDIEEELKRNKKL